MEDGVRGSVHESLVGLQKCDEDSFSDVHSLLPPATQDAESTRFHLLIPGFSVLIRVCNRGTTQKVVDCEQATGVNRDHGHLKVELVILRHDYRIR